MATTTIKTTVREWSTPEKTKITGEPPGPDAKISHTSRGEFRRQDLRVVTPIYKSQTLTSATPGGGTTVHVKSESKISPRGTDSRYPPDYKVEKEHDSYRLHIIDPKVDTRYRANSPIFNNLPAYLRKRNKTPDFPSAHSKRSFLKMDALENKRLRSYGTKIISPQEYLLESVNRHRSVSMSPLRERLNLKDRDVNLPWDPALHPGPKREAPPLKSQHKLVLPALLISLGLDKKNSEPNPEPLENFSHCSITDSIEKQCSTLHLAGTRKIENNHLQRPQHDKYQLYYACIMELKELLSKVQRYITDRRREKNKNTEDYELLGLQIENNKPETSVESFEVIRNQDQDQSPKFDQFYHKTNGKTWRKFYPVQKPRDLVVNSIKNSHQILAEERFDVNLNEKRFKFLEKPQIKPEIKILGKIWQPPPEEPYQFPVKRHRFKCILNENPEDKVHLWRPITTNSDNFKYERKNFTPRNSPPTTQGYSYKYERKNFTPRESPEREDPFNKIPILGYPQKNSNVNKSLALEIKFAKSDEKSALDQLPSERSQENGSLKRQSTKPMCENSVNTALDTKNSVQNKALNIKDIKSASNDAIDGSSKHRPHDIKKSIPSWNRFNADKSTNAGSALQYENNFDKQRSFLCPTNNNSRAVLTHDPSILTKSLFINCTSSENPTFDGSLVDNVSCKRFDFSRKLDAIGSISESFCSNSSGFHDSNNLTKEKFRLNFYPNCNEFRHKKNIGRNIRKKLNIFDSKDRPVQGRKIYFGDPLPVLFETSTSTSKKHDWSKSDLDDLAKRRERLFDRSKNRSALNINEYRKVDPNYVDLPEREFFDDSLEMSKSSTTRDPYRSQSVMSTTEWESYDRNISKTRSQTNLASWQFNNASFSPRSVINVNGHQNDTGLLKIRTDLSPAPVKLPAVAPHVQKSNAGVQTQTKTEQVTRTVVNEPGQQPPYWNVPPGGVMPQIVFVPVAAAAPTSAPNTLTRETVKEEKIRYVRDYEPGDSDSRQGTLIRIKDDSAKKPPSTTSSKHHRRKHVVRHEKYESEGDNAAEKENRQLAIPRQNLLKEVEQLEPKVTETVSTVEETKRTEEVERRVRADKKHRRKDHKSKHHRSHDGHLEEAGHRQERIGYSYGSNGHAGRAALDYPSWASGEQRTPNGYHPNITETYQRESTTRRMHESDADDHGRLRYTENGDLNNGGQDRVHRSYSSTNVYRDFPRQTELYYENGRPIVEYPPSTTTTMDDRFYNRHGSRHLGRYGRRAGGSELSSSSGPATPRKSDLQNGGVRSAGGDSLLMPAAAMGGGAGNVDEREFRRDEIPGGHETFSRTLKSQSGLRNDGTHFSEAKQEVNVRRETSERKI